ncbi:GntP family permease [Flammeovirgaceae bacterium SG7u.111]|nr:GntP family permease [Flammeovirgaceae bacterium SG7u.132]WPO34917.1 GntP family permease [Flammeovirgaceae bacterium SG7u.111]
MESILILVFCIALLIVSITVVKVHPIPALLVAGLILGLAVGNDVSATTESLLSGFGNTLKWIGLVILFGTLLGEILAVSGGADVIADTIIKTFGLKRLPLSMAIIGFLIGIPVFVDVAYLTLLPTILALSRKSGHSVLVLGLSLSMSLTVAHAMIPPTPGPLAVPAILELEVGEIILPNVLTAIFAITGGFLFIRFNKKKLQLKANSEAVAEEATGSNLEGIYRVLPFAALLLPLALMAAGNFASEESQFISFIKNPIWALMIGVAISLPLLQKKNFSENLNNLINEAAKKSAIVILITGAGGAFGQVIKDTKIVNSLFTDAGNLTTISILVPFFLSMLFTTVTGSITVALITTSSIMAPLVFDGMLDARLAASAICAGSLGMIHVNSSFFWLFKEVHQLSVGKVLKSFSILSAIVALSGGLFVFIYSLIGQ